MSAKTLFGSSKSPDKEKALNMAMPNIPILRHRNWPYLLKDLLNSSYASQLYGLNQRSLGLALLAPAAAARGIATLAPELLGRGKLSILVAGAEFHDATDAGQWYQLMGWLLGQPAMAVDVTLVGLELDQPEDIPPWELDSLKVRPGLFKPARKYQGHFSDFLDANSDYFDLVCLFHPGLAGHAEWYESDVLRRLFAVGDVLLGSSYGPSELPDDMFMADLYGIGLVGEAQINPFAVRAVPGTPAINPALADQLGDTDWGSVLWRPAIQSDTISPHAALFTEGVKILDANIAASKHANGLQGMNDIQHQLVYAGLRLPSEKVAEFPGFPQGHAAIKSLQNCLIDAETGQFYDAEQGHLIDTIVPPEDMAAYPQAAMDSMHTMPLVLWSVAVWYRYMVKEESRGDAAESDLDASMSALRADPGRKANAAHAIQQLMGDKFGADEIAQLTNAIFGKEKRTVTPAERPIIDAYHNRDFTLALRLIAANPRLVDAMDADWTTGLYQIVPNDLDQVAADLLEHGADTEHRDGEGWTPLMYASYHNATAVMQVLLDYGADIDAQSPLGFTPLHFAVSNGSESAATLLLDYDANVDVPCSAGYSVRDLAKGQPAAKDDLRDRVLTASVAQQDGKER